MRNNAGNENKEENHKEGEDVARNQGTLKRSRKETTSFKINKRMRTNAANAYRQDITVMPPKKKS